MKSIRDAKDRLRFKHKQQGLTMIELMIVLGIIAIVVVFILLKSEKADDSVDQSKTVDTVNLISQGIHQIYSSSSDYSDVTNGDISPLVPKNMLHGTKVGTAWYHGDNNSIITIAPSATKTQFVLTLNDIPQDDCEGIASQFFNGAAASVSVNGTTASKMGDIATGCQSGKGTTTIALTFN